MSVQRVQLPDNMEDVVLQLQSLFRTHINTFITEKFNDKASTDTDLYGEVIPAPTITNGNVLLGDFNTVKLNLETIPSILIDYESEQFATVLTMHASNNKAYTINIYVSVMYDRPLYVNIGLLRTVFATVQFLADYGRLQGFVNDGAVQQILYSLPIEYQSGWFRGAAIQMAYNGRVGG